MRREELEDWTGLAHGVAPTELAGPARAVHDALASLGAMFSQELTRRLGATARDVEEGLGQLAARGLVTCDSFGGLRALVLSSSRARGPARASGRWSVLRRGSTSEAPLERVARQLLRRTGVLFRRLLEREKMPVAWRDLLRVLRRLEARGELRGGRFVAGFEGEQFALPEAVEGLREARRAGARPPLYVSAADPLNLRGVLTPDERVPQVARRKVLVA